MSEILIVYYSRGGSVARLARQIARGVGETAGVHARLRSVPPVAPVTRASEPPVNLSYQLHQTVPVLAPGATLVFSLDNHGCESEVDLLAQSAVLRASGAAQPPAFMRAPRAPRG